MGVTKPAVFLAAFLVFGCTKSPPPGQPTEPAISVSGTWLHFVGPITKASVEAVRKSLSGRKLVGLSINSGGGDVEAALDIGKLVQDHQLEVEVRTWCMSSCANYIFPSGTRKRITEGAVVAWHGSPSHVHFLDIKNQGSVDPAIRQFNAALAKREAAFMHSIGVDPFVSWFGKIAPYNAPNFYALTVADMNAFGINNIVAPDSYGPRYLAAMSEGMRTGLVFISADAAAIQASRPPWLR